MISYVTVFLVVMLGRLSSSNFPVDRSDWSTLSFTGESVIDLKRLRCNERRKNMFTDDRSLTVRYKLGEVGESEFLSHWNKIKQIHGASLPEKMLWHPQLFIGYVLPNYVGGAVLDFVRSLPGVESVSRSKVYRSTSLSWGLDRIDQRNLPLDGSYSPDFNGTGVNVYIVDSGIDTEHSEFQPVEGKLPRIVENVFDISSSSFIFPNNDGVGHGTHVAGIVGGNTVGVSPGCNIFGVKVLASNGGGTDFDIVKGLSFVLDVYSYDKKPTIVSMSLGGTCASYDECSKDLLVMAVETLSSAGIVVVTAAGNSDCDSCLTTPAYAPQGITVGASSVTDDAAVFSDFGKCIDIYAPGVDIISACGSKMCPTGELNQYKNLSGTSMACPYVSGVVAQLLQGHPTSTVANITTMLSCAASSMVLSIVQDRPPSVTRNLLVQVPKRRITIQPTAQPTRSPTKPSLSSSPTTASPTIAPSDADKSSSSPSAPSDADKSSSPPTSAAADADKSSSPPPSAAADADKSSSPPPTKKVPPSPATTSRYRALWGVKEEKLGPEMCNLGAGCEQFNNCSDRGICQNGRCLCDALAWGPDCSSVEFGSHCGKVRQSIMQCI